MQVILSRPACISTCNNTIQEKFEQAAANDWQTYATRSPVSRKQLQCIELLETNQVEFRRQQGATLRKAYTAMLECSISQPCRLFRCRRCAEKLHSEMVDRLAPIASRYTANRRGIAIQIGAGSSRWNGRLSDKKFTVIQEINTLHNILNELPILDGHRLSLDVSTLKVRGELQFQIHLHGTLLCRERDVERLQDLLRGRLIENQLDVELWIQPINGHWKSNGPNQRASFCSESQIKGWFHYAEKIAYQRDTVKNHCELIAELSNMPTHWTGGLFKTNQPAITALPRRQLVTLINEIEQLKRLQEEHQITDRFKVHYETFESYLVEIRYIDHLRLERERKRYERRRAAYSKQQHTYNRTSLPEVRSDWKKTSQARRLRAKARLDEQNRRYKSCWQGLHQTLSRILKLTVKLISKDDLACGCRFKDYVESSLSGNTTTSSLLVSAVTVISNLANMRRRLTGYFKLYLQLGDETLLEARRMLEANLRDLQDFWPALGRRESIDHLNWQSFWRRWRKSILQLL